MSREIVIVGGVAGGANVAAQLRREDKEANITLLDKGEHIAFSTCGMPYYIGDVIEDRNDLLTSSEKIAKKFNIQVYTNATVTTIDRDNKQITYYYQDNKQNINYDKLILTPGASAVKPDFKGINDQRTFTLHTIPDMDAIKSYIETHQPKTAAIVGTGFVGMEMVENLKALDIDCTMIDHSKQVMNLVDKDMADPVEDHIKDKNVDLFLNESLESFSKDGTTLNLTSGKQIEADMTILAVGISPNTELAKESSLTIGETGAIAVNQYMQTSDPDIYALGDAVETHDFITGVSRHVALAGPAHRQAAIAADHLNNGSLSYKGIQGTAIFKIFDLSVGAVGINQAVLEAQNIPYKEVVHESLAHAAYYPGAEKIRIKLLFSADVGTLYGAQVVGFEGVDKRLAILASAMRAKMSIHELPDLELGYAPPYSSPKDPVNIAGYKAISKLSS